MVCLMAEKEISPLEIIIKVREKTRTKSAKLIYSTGRGIIDRHMKRFSYNNKPSACYQEQSNTNYLIQNN